MGMYIKDEEHLKECILNILYKQEMDDPAHGPTDESYEKTANNLILLFSAMIRNERLGLK